MKRKSWIVTVLIAAVICLLASSALADSPYGHTHSWLEVRRIQSTCSTHGRITYRCRCGATKVEQLPTTGHAYGPWEVTTPPTCEQEGVRTHTCSACGRTETKPVDALGHAWNEGVMTKEPGYLNPGIMTFTCVTCGSTRTEEIPVKPLPISLFNGGIEDDGPEPGEFGEVFDPLRIVTQPVAGSIDRDGGSLLLSVEAAGGVPPYRYQWRTAYNGWWSLWRNAEDGTDSTLEAKKGNYRYYCKVYDSMCDHVARDSVLVGWNLYIAKQPENTANCEMDPVILTCKAAGGVPFNEEVDYPYAYTWMSADGDVMGYGPTLTVEHVGEYYCHVEDSVLNATQSKVAIVYEADPFECKTDAPVVELLDGQDYELWAEAYGGIEPYTGVWMRDGVEIPTQQVKDGEFTAQIVGDGSKEAVYTFVAHDAMDDDCSLTVKVIYPQLKIVHHPQSGTLPGKGDYTINIEMGEGTLPITYTLYRNGEVTNTVTHDSLRSNLHVFDSGEYYYHVEDAEGRWADSNVAVVTDFEFQIEHLYVDGPIYDSTGTILKAVVNGGVEPITYGWWYIAEDGHGEQLAKGEKSSYTVYRPGKYLCYAEDAEKHSDRKEAQVIYEGTAPIIIQQPANVLLPYNPDAEVYSATFTCKAIAYDGSTDCLKYRWEKKESGGWKDALINPWNNGVMIWEKHPQYSGTEGAVYRCVVTDIRNGKETVSNEAYAAVELSLQVNYAKILPEIRECAVDFDVYGGIAPYDVKLYAHRIYGIYEQDFFSRFYLDHDESIRDLFKFANTCEEEKTYDQIPKNRHWDYKCYNTVYTYPSWDPTDLINQTVFSEFYLIVTDGSGQQYVTPYLAEKSN